MSIIVSAKVREAQGNVYYHIPLLNYCWSNQAKETFLSIPPRTLRQISLEFDYFVNNLVL